MASVIYETILDFNRGSVTVNKSRPIKLFGGDTKKELKFLIVIINE